MAKKVLHERPVQKTGNVLRSVLVWTGLLAAVAAGLVLLLAEHGEKIALALVVLAIFAYGFVLRDLDLDDDD